jgi:hypothetical protein
MHCPGSTPWIFSTNPLGQRISISSILVAAPNPKCSRKSLVLESKFGVDMTDLHLSFGNKTDPKSLGMQPISGVTQIDGLPQINISNYVNGGFGNSALWHDNIKTFTLSETVTWIRGKHTIKIGGENVSTLLHPFNDQNNRGIWNYTGLAFGNEYADFLLSQPATKQFSAGPGGC